MTGEELVSFWPPAAFADRPKNLFVDYTITEEENAALESRGWVVWDTRRLPNRTDTDRAEGLKCLLEGIRVGSVSPDKEKMRWMELEAKVYGLLTGKDKLADKVPQVNQEVLDNLLDFGEKKGKVR